MIEENDLDVHFIEVNYCPDLKMSQHFGKQANLDIFNFWVRCFTGGDGTIEAKDGWELL